MGTRKNALVTLLAALMISAGCATSADTPADDETGDGDGGDDGDGTDGVEPTDDEDDVEVAKENVIDDLEDNNDAILDSEDRSGSWYTFNDESPGGEQTPGSNFKPTAGGANGSKYAAVTSGKGFKEWGAGMGFDLNYGGEALNGKPKPVWDASKLKGVTFMLKSKTPAVRFGIATTAVTSKTEGGTCVGGTTDATMCDNVHGADLKASTEWKRFTIKFADLKQEEGWGKVEEFDAKKLIGLQFAVPQNVTFELAVDDIAFF